VKKNDGEKPMNRIEIDLSIEETNLILEALGQLPFVRVYQVIGRLQESARAQLQGPTAQRDAPHGGGPPGVRSAPAEVSA
jgi:hypothetical protein